MSEILNKANINELIDDLPDLPGIYIFKDSAGKIIYVGKAKSIKKRVKNHFANSPDPKHAYMISNVADIDYITTSNEIEALLLEYNLIKQVRPEFNVLYRDDKTYPYISVTVSDEWPKIMITRNLNIKGAAYFGPYPKASAAREVLNALLKIFPLRTCKGEKPGKRGETPCLMFQIKKCTAPCVGAVSRDEYMSFVRSILEFLSGKSDWLVDRLEKEMKEAAEKLEFEKAAAIREKLLAARYVMSQQRVALEKKIDADVVGFYKQEKETGSYVRILVVRRGRIIGAYGYSFPHSEYESAVYDALMIFYTDASDFPRELIIPEHLPPDKEKEIDMLLGTRSARKVKITVPRRGPKRDLVSLAYDNAVQGYFWSKFHTRASLERSQSALKEAYKLLGLKRIPLRIECYDMSGFREENPVGTMVVFQDGMPLRKAYRKFKIRGRGESDFHKVYEVIQRRFKKAGSSKDEAFSKIPDLVIIDGGKAQLNAAVKALQDVSEELLERLDVIALAKPENIVYKAGSEEPVKLPHNSEALKILVRARDEAHRTAVSYFRRLEEKRIKTSILDRIKGIGPKRRKKLIEYFGDIDRIRKASIKELSSVVPFEIAVRVKDELNKE
jgi:excinuclease ABC subunit C